ncbi:hypothetical protein H5410_008831 [Solanum commersonii]|uniref:Uncharacterized protein n=1 Tax=Solanum commersonii TaxID=4109 RepID=A0A9J6AG23_SOLCO|nr:hypothetical protein H5410_008831 [Solanum commersonii]
MEAFMQLGVGLNTGSPSFPKMDMIGESDSPATAVAGTLEVSLSALLKRFSVPSNSVLCCIQ